MMRPCVLISLAALATAPVPALAQRTSSDRDWYTVGGERHGISFFPEVRHPGVEYEAGDHLTFDRYHTADVMYTWLERWADAYPNLVELYEVERSFEGRPILQVTLTSRETGAAATKPAAYFEGGRHAGEVTGSESVLWLIQHLLEGYGHDDAITELLDTKAVYLRPQNNPDGSSLYLHTAQSNRSTVRPHDSDRDGLVDEDAPEDLDGDGVVYDIRRRVRPGEEDEGNYVLDERDPTGRLMRRVEAGQGDWIVADEGIDNDGDGRVNEDGIGGLDLHRNYPENWRPEPGRDATRRGFTQNGAGEFPLSEPETRATVLWLLTHPHVSVVNSMDTQVPMHLRPPSTSRGADRMYPEDLALYEYFDSVGVSITGYPWAGDVYEDYATRTRVNPFTGDSSRPGPLFGHGPDFGYFYFGAIWYGDELWNGGRVADLNGDGEVNQVDALLWDDRENGGRGFREWRTFQHPALGEVEIGGFHPKFFSQNAPPEHLEPWIRNQALFNLEMAFHLPQVDEVRAGARRVSQDGDSATYEVEVRWTNSGRLPTALLQAQLVKIVQEDHVRLEFDQELTSGPAPSVRIVDPTRRDKAIYADRTLPGETKTVRFLVRTYGIRGAEGTVQVRSTRGGEVEVPVTLGHPESR